MNPPGASAKVAIVKFLFVSLKDNNPKSNSKGHNLK